MALIILLFVIISVICYRTACADTYNGVLEGMTNNSSSNMKWSRNECPYVVGETLENIFKKYNVEKNDNDWNVYLPCSYDNPTTEIEKMPIVKGGKYFIIENCDIMVAKNSLWDYVAKHYGLDKAKTMLPASYILLSDTDLARFNKDYDKDKLYIMKKNIQRQEGLKITNNKEEILNGKNDKFVVVQELLQNPYIIDKRKIDMRFYVFIICKNNKVNVYVHKNGFMYYTKVPFVKGSSEKDVNVTTGYIDRSVYEKNPLTHDDLRKYLDNPNRQLSEIESNLRKQGLNISQVLFQRIYHLLRDVFTAFIGHICPQNKFANNDSFQLFGIDVAVDANLNPMVLEINKGPDLNSKDLRDSKLKHVVVRDFLRLAGVINDADVNESNGFIKII